MPSNESRDRQASTGRTGDSEQCGPALVRAEARAAPTGARRQLCHRANRETAKHQYEWQAGLARAEARGSADGSSQTLMPSYNISQRGLDDRKHGRQGSSESGGAKQRRRELSNNNAIERKEIPPSVYQQELGTVSSAGQALARAERRGSTDGSSRTILPSSGSRGHQASTSKSWTTASMAARLWRAEGRGSADGGSRTMKPSSETRDERSSSNDR